MRPLAAGAACAGLFGVLALAAAPARGAPCGQPNLVDMVPPDQAADVPPNATLAAHYAASADYLGEPVVLVLPDGEEQTLPATFDATEVRLSITPGAPLAAGGPYVVRWPALRGLNAAAPGVGGQATFSVVTTPDSAPPMFDGVAAVRWHLDRSTNDCTDSIEERFTFDLDLGAASDDGGRDGLTLLLFQTSGPGAGDGSVPVLARALPPEGQSAQVALPTGDSVGRICFAGLVRDTTGQVSNSADREACVETTDPPFFQGCELAPNAEREVTSSRFGLLAVALTVGLAVRRRRGRSRP